ncbi:hypothetical protein EDC01DRAFT_651962 [Geopyxis carbonaria]|nr:hypothetical protein EDC01DRAFT_651962 [Geopyxis carbonaria]
MPLPAVPPPQSTTNSSPPGSLRSRSPLKLKIPAASAPAPLTEEEARKQRLDGNFSPDVNYGKDIADWAESFYTSKTPNSSSSSSASPAIHVSQSAINPATRASVLNPEGAVRGMLLPQQPIRRPSRRSTVRVSTQRAMSMSPSEWSRISYASSIGDAFQYDAFADSGALGTIGEDETTDTPNHAATTSPTADDDDEYTSDLDDDDLLNGFPDDLDTDTYSTYSTYSRVSTASTALLDSEIDAILGTGAPPRRDTALSEYSEYSYYDGSSSPSTPGLLEADIDQLLAETTGGLSGTGEMQSRRMTAIMEHGLGFDISDLEIADYGEKTRQTRYLKGRNSELDSELGESGVLFCIPGKEMVGGGWTEKGYR